MVNDSYDYENLPARDLDKALAAIRESVLQNLDASIDLVWKDKKNNA